MPNNNWSTLNRLQLGRYAEYIAKMEFASYGLEVFTSEVDDRGIDFIVKDKTGRFLEIQVKSKSVKGYVYAEKVKFNIENRSLFMVLIIFNEGMIPELFLIPAEIWKHPNEVLVDRKYNKPGQKSKPEYGINISKKHFDILRKFEFSKVIRGVI